MKITNIFELGSTLEVDKDHVLKEFQKGSLLLINLKPQEYAYEQHDNVDEMIIAFKGSFILETESEEVIIPEGSMITVPRGVKHRFGKESDGLILVAFG
ncbi:cupin domain-containing protein [Gottfriedia sp. OAE603]|uniref:cupin domain-containing protein n=1 Tax=Gottfriedia sp. OAE603 TaxID=2663872 RepID=UPI0017893010